MVVPHVTSFEEGGEVAALDTERKNARSAAAERGTEWTVTNGMKKHFYLLGEPELGAFLVPLKEMSEQNVRFQVS